MFNQREANPSDSWEGHYKRLQYKIRNLTLDSWEGFLLEGPGHFFQPSPGQPGTVASLPFLAQHQLLQHP